MTEKLQSGKKNNVVSWTQKSHEHFNTAKSEIVNLQLQNIVRIYRTWSCRYAETLKKHFIIIKYAYCCSITPPAPAGLSKLWSGAVEAGHALGGEVGEAGGGCVHHAGIMHDRRQSGRYITCTLVRKDIENMRKVQKIAKKTKNAIGKTC